MNVQRITTWQELCALEAPWNDLAAGMPFRSWDWLATWWKHYSKIGGEKQLCVFVVHDDAPAHTHRFQPKPLGIAPWYLDRTVVKGDVLRWLGSGEVCTDHLAPLCRPEHKQLVAAALAEMLTTTCDDWDRLELSAVDAHDSATAMLVSELEQRECLVTRQAADACWVLELPPTWDDYLATVSKSHRKQLRQLERRVLQSPRARWNRVISADELTAAWPILIDLHQRRRKSLGESGCFASRAFYEFHYEVTTRLVDRGQLRVSWLQLDGTPIAAEYHLADHATTYAYQGGVDPDRLAEEPGRLSTILCLKQAIAEGHTRLDFLRGDEPYKAHWRATPQPTLDYAIVPNRRLAKLRGRVLNLTESVRDWVRQPTPVPTLTPISGELPSPVQTA